MRKYGQYDKIWIGILAGFLTAFVGYAIILMIFEQINNLIRSGIETTGNEVFDENFRKRTSAILAISLNILVLQWFNKNVLYKGTRGVVIATFLTVAIWLTIFWEQFFG